VDAGSGDSNVDDGIQRVSRRIWESGSRQAGTKVWTKGAQGAQPILPVTWADAISCPAPLSPLRGCLIFRRRVGFSRRVLFA